MQQRASYPEVYTVEEFAKVFKLSPEAVRTLIRKGEIPAIRIGKQYRIARAWKEYNLLSRAKSLFLKVFLTDIAFADVSQQLEEDGIIIRRRVGRRNEYEIDFDALRSFPRWSPGEWKIPDELIDVAVHGLQSLVMRSGGPGYRQVTRPSG